MWETKTRPLKKTSGLLMGPEQVRRPKPCKLYEEEEDDDDDDDDDVTDK